MEKTILNSIYGVQANKYVDTDVNTRYVSVSKIADTLTAKIHATITYYLALLDNRAEFAEQYAIKEDDKVDSCFHYMALEAHSCYDSVINTIFELSQWLIDYDFRKGDAYENFKHELAKAKNIGHKMFEAIHTVEGYEAFALDVRKGLIQ